ncbi:hypothetical protein GUITHDRAFT_115236 [Guillardia theta CCMP2712]|uniref:Ubiquitin-like domain-containing protein n=1 Tax=Guillardia theta (strain CCMP2712) TaxID=905079 RepID=L1IR00_GUITC|nr:hypothetical protein GUITHDRAFT_115236 [Guillardia theta CCMP2712]EKX38688.1 hypothetical protein GUITHDRAFT_115236 [Guillardia theta CCMP2712]|eukprot:XP_005825668.1 hypothetical protein GUITHDRAFT_115236 [Guillardia theta CCMP2712]
MSTPSSVQPRRVMSFEEAMENAAKNPRRQGCTKYNVEVYLQLPLEGQSHYKEAFQSPSIDFFKSAGVPPGPSISERSAYFQDCQRNPGGYDIQPISPSIPFTGRTTNQEMYQPYDIPRATGPSREEVSFSPSEYRLVPDNRDFKTSNKEHYAYYPPETHPPHEIARKIRIVISRNATVGDLQEALQKQTQIPIHAQSLIRDSTGQVLEDKNLLLVDNLNWKSGEFLTMTVT